MVNFREFVTSSGLKIFGGKDAKNNDELVYYARPKDILLHTDAPGSSFVNVGGSPLKKDIKEAAIFCARYSQDWRDNKKDIVINKFSRSDMNKSSKMKIGSWEVEKREKIKVKKNAILEFEKRMEEKNEAN